MPDVTVSSDIDLFLKAANDAAARTELGLGTMATQAASTVAITGGTIAGATYNGLAITSTTGTLIIANGQTFDVTAAGELSGTNTGDQVNVSGNAVTATTLQNARTINGTSFNGSANITVTAEAGTLTGTTLNATVVTSSLTSVGTLVGGATGAGFTVALATSTITGALAVENGGTAATTAAAARAALGAAALQNKIQIANQVVTNSTTFVDSTDCTMALGVGTYLCESFEVVLNSSIVNLSKTKVNFSGTATQTAISVWRRFSTDLGPPTIAEVLYDQAGGAVAYNTSQVNFGTNRSMIIRRRWTLGVTVAGTLSIQFATSLATDGGTATILASSFLTAIHQ